MDRIKKRISPRLVWVTVLLFFPTIAWGIEFRTENGKIYYKQGPGQSRELLLRVKNLTDEHIRDAFQENFKIEDIEKFKQWLFSKYPRGNQEEKKITEPQIKHYLLLQQEDSEEPEKKKFRAGAEPPPSLQTAPLQTSPAHVPPISCQTGPAATLPVNPVTPFSQIFSFFPQNSPSSPQIEVPLAELIAKAANFLPDEVSLQSLSDLQLILNQTAPADRVELVRQDLENLGKNQFEKSQIFRELVSNGIDARSQPGGKVEVIAPPDQPDLLAIRDSGSASDPRQGMGLREALYLLLTPYRSSSDTPNNPTEGDIHTRIGQFGQGFLSVLSLLESPTDRITIRSKKPGNPGIRITLRREQGQLRVAFQLEDLNEPGTSMEIRSSVLRNQIGGNKTFRQKVIEDTIPSRFRYIQSTSVVVNGTQINRDLSPFKKTEVTIGQNQKANIYSCPVSDDPMPVDPGKLAITLKGVVIYEIPIQGDHICPEVMIELPKNFRITSDRETLNFNDSTLRNIVLKQAQTLIEKKDILTLNSLAPLLGKEYLNISDLIQLPSSDSFILPTLNETNEIAEINGKPILRVHSELFKYSYLDQLPTRFRQLPIKIVPVKFRSPNTVYKLAEIEGKQVLFIAQDLPETPLVLEGIRNIYKILQGQMLQANSRQPAEVQITEARKAAENITDEELKALFSPPSLQSPLDTFALKCAKQLNTNTAHKLKDNFLNLIVNLYIRNRNNLSEEKDCSRIRTLLLIAQFGMPNIFNNESNLKRFVSWTPILLQYKISPYILKWWRIFSAPFYNPDSNQALSEFVYTLNFFQNLSNKYSDEELKQNLADINTLQINGINFMSWQEKDFKLHHFMNLFHQASQQFISEGRTPQTRERRKATTEKSLLQDMDILLPMSFSKEKPIFIMYSRLSYSHHRFLSLVPKKFFKRDIINPVTFPPDLVGILNVSNFSPEEINTLISLMIYAFEMKRVLIDLFSDKKAAPPLRDKLISYEFIKEIISQYIRKEIGLSEIEEIFHSIDAVVGIFLKDVPEEYQPYCFLENIWKVLIQSKHPQPFHSLEQLYQYLVEKNAITPKNVVWLYPLIMGSSELPLTKNPFPGDQLPAEAKSFPLNQYPKFIELRGIDTRQIQKLINIPSQGRERGGWIKEVLEDSVRSGSPDLQVEMSKDEQGRLRVDLNYHGQGVSQKDMYHFFNPPGGLLKAFQEFDEMVIKSDDGISLNTVYLRQAPDQKGQIEIREHTETRESNPALESQSPGTQISLRTSRKAAGSDLPILKSQLAQLSAIFPERKITVNQEPIDVFKASRFDPSQVVVDSRSFSPPLSPLPPPSVFFQITAPCEGALYLNQLPRTWPLKHWVEGLPEKLQNLAQKYPFCLNLQGPIAENIGRTGLIDEAAIRPALQSFLKESIPRVTTLSLAKDPTPWKNLLPQDFFSEYRDQIGFDGWLEQIKSIFTGKKDWYHNKELEGGYFAFMPLYASKAPHSIVPSLIQLRNQVKAALTQDQIIDSSGAFIPGKKFQKESILTRFPQPELRPLLNIFIQAIEQKKQSMTKQSAQNDLTSDTVFDIRSDFLPQNPPSSITLSTEDQKMLQDMKRFIEAEAKKRFATDVQVHFYSKSDATEAHGKRMSHHVAFNLRGSCISLFQEMWKKGQFIPSSYMYLMTVLRHEMEHNRERTGAATHGPVFADSVANDYSHLLRLSESEIHDAESQIRSNP